MRNKKIASIIVILFAAVFLHQVSDCIGSPQQNEPPQPTTKDEPQARALYKKMIEAIRSAKTLSYESRLQEESDGEKWEPYTYRVWMKKPNFFYLETTKTDGTIRGILVGDGKHAWSYWPNGRPSFSGEDHAAYKKTKFHIYMKEPAAGRYSIGYSKIMIKSNCFPVLNPSVFQGINDSLEPHIEWIRHRGTEKVGREECDVIEVSLLDHKRGYMFWISRRDHIPRKLKDIVRTHGEHITQEVWSKVTLNADIPPEKFRWSPPDEWKQWYPPAPEDRLLKPGREAPDFELLSAGESKIKLSDYRGKIVWLVFWRVGCPPCRDAIPTLEEFHKKYKSRDVVILGFDFADDRQIALDFLQQHAVTFPNIVDTSEEAIKTGFIKYQARAAPVNYLIDRKGKIAAAWLGYGENNMRIINELAKLGLKQID